jgi:hypothetical protein
MGSVAIRGSERNGDEAAIPSRGSPSQQHRFRHMDELRCCRGGLAPPANKVDELEHQLEALHAGHPTVGVEFKPGWFPHAASTARCSGPYQFTGSNRGLRDNT